MLSAPQGAQQLDQLQRSLMLQQHQLLASVLSSSNQSVNQQRPTLGEEYPYILRDIERKIPDDDDPSHRYALVVDKCDVESCSWEDLVDIFESHEIALVSFKEIMS